MKEKPLVTIAVITYNQEQFVEDAVRSALAQTYEPLEIIISDDRSTDQTFAVIEKVVGKYRGNRNVVVRQNDINLGLCGHVNHVASIASGQFLSLAAGDDISQPTRIAESVKCLTATKDAKALSFGALLIDVKGRRSGRKKPAFGREAQHILDLREYLQSDVHLDGASRMVDRSVMEVFGPLNDDCPTEDTTMLFRAVLLGKAIYDRRPMIRYRVHSNNISNEIGTSRFPFALIEKQYRTDFERAVETGLIDRSFAPDFESWIARRRVRYEPKKCPASPKPRPLHHRIARRLRTAIPFFR